MAECVSCGKAIPAGKLFCDGCYVKMKGRRRPYGEVPPVPETRAGQAQGAEAEPAEKPQVQHVPPPAAAPARKASGTLTPATDKKVVAIKPPLERSAREKGSKKRFTVTITFSERTYATLSRLKPSGRERALRRETGAAETQTAPVRFRPGAGGGRSRGGPGLKAVTASGAAAPQSGFRKAIAYRDRAMDGKDRLSVAIAALSVLIIIIFFLLPWAKVSWGTGDASGLQTVEVTGTDLGIMAYICMSITVIALLYTLASISFKETFRALDYGVVLIVAGVLFVVLFYITISSNDRFLAAALEKLGRGGTPLPEQFERLTQWPAYIMPLAGAVLALAGWVRLLKREESAVPGGKGAGEDV